MKKFLKRILDLDNPFYNFCRKLAWIFVINILFIITSLPIVTIGASATAMYTVCNKLIEEREIRLFRDYFTAFKDNFGISTGMWMIVAILGFILFLDVQYVFFFMNGGFAILMRIATVLVAAAFVMIANGIFPVIAKFDVTFRETITTIFSMIWEHPWLSLEGLVFTVVIFGGSFWIVGSGQFLGLFILFPFLSFGLHALMQSYLYKQMFSYYISED